MLVEISLILSCFSLACSGEAASCPECPYNRMPCHQPFSMSFGPPCECHGCLTKCNARVPVCQKGEFCVTEDVHYSSVYVGQTAVCIPFQQCPQIHCPFGCPESGYFVDINDCPTCLCNDPCQEMKCTNGCRTFSTDPGTEPNYQCN